MIKFCLILLLLPYVGICQKQSHDIKRFSGDDFHLAKASYPYIQLKAIDETSIRGYIQNRVDNLRPKNTALELVDYLESPGGYHFTYIQLYNNIPIYNSQVKVNLDKEGIIRSFFDNTYSISPLPNSSFPDKDAVNDYLNSIEQPHPVSAYNTYFPDKGLLVPAVRLDIKEPDNSHYEVVLGHLGNVLQINDLNRYLKLSDSVVTASVFLPDPLTSAGVNYGGAYSDNNDNDNAELIAEQASVNIIVDFTNDTFRLSGPFVAIREFSNPVTVPAYSLSPYFNYTRSEQEFEDVNCYYHINAFQQYMQSLGFNLVNYQIGVDAHALNGQDNSMFDTDKLYFGEGCVDDAEDADVIIHEYGHAISSSAAPGTWVGFERKAMDEGLGDYLATSYTRNIHQFKWEDMFGWDGHNECWLGRTAATTKIYPADLGFDIHDAGEIWSSTLMQVWKSIGRQQTDQILLQSLYSWASNISMTDAAYLFLDADSLLNGGANYTTSYYWFEQRGILPPIPLPAPFTAILLSNNKSCNGSCNGSASVVGYAGTSPYSYQWNDSVQQTTGTATGLCTGVYTVTATDFAGTIFQDTIIIEELPVISVTSSSTPDSGNGNGTATVVVTGGTPPYSFSWNDSSAQSGSSAVALSAGIYSVSITDGNGCVKTTSLTVDLIEDIRETGASSLHFEVYPTPSNGKIIINRGFTGNDASVVKIYNSLGQMVFIRNMEHEVIADLSGNPAGIYCIMMQTKQGEGGSKILVIGH